MQFPRQKLIHWLCAIAFSWSIFTPSMAQAFFQSANENFLTMELCVVDGSKQTINLNTEVPTTKSNDCPYCVAQSIVPLNRLANLEFATPARPILTPGLYLGSTKTLFAWIKRPSQGPPSNHCI